MGMPYNNNIQIIKSNGLKPVLNSAALAANNEASRSLASIINNKNQSINVVDTNGLKSTRTNHQYHHLTI